MSWRNFKSKPSTQNTQKTQNYHLPEPETPYTKHSKDSKAPDQTPFESFEAFEGQSVISDSPAMKESQEGEQPEFDAEYWGRKIEHSTRRAMQQDNGALAYCELFMPLLYRHYMKAANNLDAAYTAQCGYNRAELVTENVTGLKEALREHDRAAEQTRKAAAQPLTADQLNPAECSRFCQAHLSDKGGECSYLNQLNGCTLWNAKNRRRSISELPVSPARYLEAHQKENP